MGQPTALQALAATRGSNDFFVASTPAERRKSAAIRRAVNRVVRECTPEDPAALDKLKAYTFEEFHRLGGAP
jgi:hypothetical protein